MDTPKTKNILETIWTKLQDLEEDARCALSPKVPVVAVRKSNQMTAIHTQDAERDLPSIYNLKV